ncbi:MAG: hypothetical protein NC311_00080 [Muribaculaceae bacterium]|nr:hypothetical protein [Muribaculaceae bacterium]
MKKILIIALIAGAPYSVYALSLIPDVVQMPDCCIGDAVGACTHFTCTYRGTTTEYTNCDTCITANTTLEMNGSYQPCGTNGDLFDVSVGKCVENKIGGITITMCEKGYYNNNGTCEPCPGGGTTAVGGSSNAITDCYIPAGTVGSDTTGTYKYTDDCYYTSDNAVISPEFPDLPVFPINP